MILLKSQFCQMSQICDNGPLRVNHSAKSSYLLKNKQEDLHHKKHSLVQDVVTRWNSAYYMVERVLEQQQPLCGTLFELRKGDLMPSDAEFRVLQGYHEATSGCD